MRLLWEQAGLGRGEVGFVRHTQPFLPSVLERCLTRAARLASAAAVPVGGELCDFARLMLADHQRAHPEAGGWRLLDPPRDHPAILGLARTAAASPLAGEAGPPGGAGPFRPG